MGKCNSIQDVQAINEMSPPSSTLPHQLFQMLRKYTTKQTIERHQEQQNQHQPTHIPGRELFDNFFLVCFQFLDGKSLATCSSVCREWHDGSLNPFLWKQLYINQYRNKRPLPVKWQHWCVTNLQTLYRQRQALVVDLSTRAKAWTRLNGNHFVHNDALNRNFYAGSIESMRTEHVWRPLFTTNKGSVCYFEASIQGCGSIGIVSITSTTERLAYGFGSDNHIGWYPVSYGYHSDNGALYWNDGNAPVGGYEREYGPTWGSTTIPRSSRRTETAVVVGCGYDLTHQRLFFTLNGAFVGYTPLRILGSRSYAAAVSLHQMGDSAELNFGGSPFSFDIEEFIATQPDPYAVAA